MHRAGRRFKNKLILRQKYNTLGLNPLALYETKFLLDFSTNSRIFGPGPPKFLLYPYRAPPFAPSLQRPGDLTPKTRVLRYGHLVHLWFLCSSSLRTVQMEGAVRRYRRFQIKFKMFRARVARSTRKPKRRIPRPSFKACLMRVLVHPRPLPTSFYRGFRTSCLKVTKTPLLCKTRVQQLSGGTCWGRGLSGKELLLTLSVGLCVFRPQAAPHSLPPRHQHARVLLIRRSSRPNQIWLGSQSLCKRRYLSCRRNSDINRIPTATAKNIGH